MMRNKQHNYMNRSGVDWSEVVIVPILAGIMAAALFFLNRIAGTIGAIIAVYLSVHCYSMAQKTGRSVLEAIEGLDMEFDEVTKNAVFGMPFPMAVLNGEGAFLWYNSAFKRLFGIEESRLGMSFDTLLTQTNLASLKRKSDEPFKETIDARTYLFYHNVTDGRKQDKLILLYGVDHTEDEAIRQAWEDEQIVVWSVLFDNYDEVRNKIPESDRPFVFAQVDRIMNDYAERYEASLVKYETDRYTMIMRNSMFVRAEADKFSVLEDIHQLRESAHIRPTLSIGIGVGDLQPIMLHRQSRQAIDIALSRGGDQIVIKKDEELRYFGGKNQATERFTKVKARVMGNAISQFIDQASKVFIMGHKNADMDSLGSCLGMWSLLNHQERTAYIVLDSVTVAIENLHARATEEIEALKPAILTPQQALSKLDDNALIMVLDNHRHDSTACPELLDHGNNIIIIDHHRRGGDYISNAEISYIEPFASSTSEMVTELISYIDEDYRIPKVIAEGLLAGITVDTKNFFYQTGIRTFEAAALLKRQGADSIVIKKLFADDFELIKYRSAILAEAKPFHGDMIIGRFEAPVEGAVLIGSQAADMLLGVRGIKASFVLVKAQDRVHISARSTGDVSVQLIMEKIGGGGHLTASATQLDMTMDEAEAALKQAIVEYCEEEQAQ